MICTIFKSAGTHIIGLTLFYLTFECKYRIIASFQAVSQQSMHSTDCRVKQVSDK